MAEETDVNEDGSVLVLAVEERILSHGYCPDEGVSYPIYGSKYWVSFTSTNGNHEPKPVYTLSYGPMEVSDICMPVPIEFKELTQQLDEIVRIYRYSRELLYYQPVVFPLIQRQLCWLLEFLKANQMNHVTRPLWRPGWECFVYDQCINSILENDNAMVPERVVEKLEQARDHHNHTMAKKVVDMGEISLMEGI